MPPPQPSQLSLAQLNSVRCCLLPRCDALASRHLKQHSTRTLRCPQAAVAAAQAGNHAAALSLYDQLAARLAAAHVTHPQLHVALSNRAASNLALGRHAEALAVRARARAYALCVLRAL